MNYEIKTLNGITCIFAPMHESNSITIQIGVKAGAIYETEQEAGLSHFLEHMFFKGGKKRTTPKAVATQMDKIGAEFNAWTGQHRTAYYVKSAPHFAVQGLELLADMMIDAQFPAAELEREKGVVIQELKMYEDQPIHVCDEKRQRFFFGEGSYGRPIIGYEETINGFTAQALFDYKKSLYTKDNLIISIAGKILDQKGLEEMIATLFADLPEQKQREKPEFSWSLPVQKSDFFKKGTEQNHLIISMPGLDGLQEEKYAASVLCTILGGNMSSRLFQNIREKLGLCYYIRAGHASAKEFGYFSLRAGLDKAKFQFGCDKIHDEVDSFLTEGFTDEEFENAKNYLIGGIQMGIESSDEMVDFLENQYLTYGNIKTLDELLMKYQQVKKEEVEALFPYLNREKRRSYHIE